MELPFILCRRHRMALVQSGFGGGFVTRIETDDDCRRGLRCRRSPVTAVMIRWFRVKLSLPNSPDINCFLRIFKDVWFSEVKGKAFQEVCVNKSGLMRSSPLESDVEPS